MPHFEIHATDTKRARAFYSGLLGWSFEPVKGFEEVEYFLISGDGIGGDTRLTGGMMKRMGNAPASGSPIRGCTLTFEVADVDKSYGWALSNGGAEALPPMDYPGFGRAAYCEDGEGNIVGLITSAKGN